MEWSPAEKQQIVWDISVGNDVTANEVDWAVKEGYVDREADGLRVTEKGWAFYRRS
jgi:hypothetical protein